MEHCFSRKRNEVLTCATTWINMKNMRNEKSQTQKVTYCVISLISTYIPQKHPEQIPEECRSVFVRG